MLNCLSMCAAITGMQNRRVSVQRSAPLIGICGSNAIGDKLRGQYRGQISLPTASASSPGDAVNHCLTDRAGFLKIESDRATFCRTAVNRKVMVELGRTRRT